VYANYTYDANGNRLTESGTAGGTGSGSLANPFQYTGREADSASQLYHYRARVYDPEARRFVQQDPAGTVDGTNKYAYVGNYPVNCIDRSGKVEVCVFGFSGLVALVQTTVISNISSRSFASVPRTSPPASGAPGSRSPNARSGGAFCQTWRH